MDADGRHDPADNRRLLSKLDKEYDMVVGARGRDSQAGAHRVLANSSAPFRDMVVNHCVADLTLGFRVFRTHKFRKFLYLLPNGFSYSTTLTMSFLPRRALVNNIVLINALDGKSLASSSKWWGPNCPLFDPS